MKQQKEQAIKQRGPSSSGGTPMEVEAQKQHDATRKRELEHKAEESSRKGKDKHCTRKRGTSYSIRADKTIRR